MEPLTPCGKIPDEIRKRILEGQTPFWVPKNFKKSYNTIEKASMELADIQCSQMRFVDAWIDKKEILYVRVQRNTVLADLEIGRIPGIKKAWIQDGKLYYTYIAHDFWDRVKDHLRGGFIGGVIIALLFLVL